MTPTAEQTTVTIYHDSQCGSCTCFRQPRQCVGQLGCPAHREHPESIRCAWWAKATSTTIQATAATGGTQ
jgi:hypothetical protein